MGDLLKKLFSRTANLWSRWSVVQKGMLVAVIAVIIGGFIALLRVSSAPVMVSVIDAPINDEEARYRIMTRINEENVKVSITANNLIQVPDGATARRMRAILVKENLIPKGINPWEIFDMERWTTTDMERNVRLQRALTEEITLLIKAYDEIDDARVIIERPNRELFQADQKPVSASVIIFPKPASDISDNRKKIESIQNLLKTAIAGLRDENITITNNEGLQLNDFEGMRESDRLALIERENKITSKLEAEYRGKVLNALQQSFSANRVKDLNIKFDYDLSKKSIEKEEFFPITVKPRTPGLAYDDSELAMSITRSSATADTKWEGTGQNPEGPAGVEGQTPPAFKDMSNLYGRMTQETNQHNEEINSEKTQEERSPQIKSVSISAFIDGTWKWKYDEKGNPVIGVDNSIEREYTPVPEELMEKTRAVVRGAIGYSAARGDTVSIENIPFDRTAEFKAEDEAYFRKKQIQMTVIVFLSGLTLLLFGFILFRMISREMERRRRLAEEERARREQMLRESAMAEAEQEGMDVSISLEERNRMELMESAINLAKEHPEDAAQLIRTWLLEE